MSAGQWRQYDAAASQLITSDHRGVVMTGSPAGCPLPVDVEEVLAGPDGAPSLFTGHGPKGQRWLVAQVGESAEARRWLCAPASDLAIRCVVSGRAQPADLFRHSATGAVEDVTIGFDGRLFESVRLCAELSDSDMPSERLISHYC